MVPLILITVLLAWNSGVVAGGYGSGPEQSDPRPQENYGPSSGQKGQGSSHSHGWGSSSDSGRPDQSSQSLKPTHRFYSFDPNRRPVEESERMDNRRGETGSSWGSSRPQEDHHGGYNKGYSPISQSQYQRPSSGSGSGSGYQTEERHGGYDKGQQQQPYPPPPPREHNHGGYNKGQEQHRPPPPPREDNHGGYNKGQEQQSYRPPQPPREDYHAGYNKGQQQQPYPPPTPKPSGGWGSSRNEPPRRPSHKGNYIERPSSSNWDSSPGRYPSSSSNQRPSEDRWMGLGRPSSGSKASGGWSAEAQRPPPQPPRPRPPPPPAPPREPQGSGWGQQSSGGSGSWSSSSKGQYQDEKPKGWGPAPPPAPPREPQGGGWGQQSSGKHSGMMEVTPWPEDYSMAMMKKAFGMHDGPPSDHGHKGQSRYSRGSSDGQREPYPESGSYEIRFR